MQGHNLLYALGVLFLSRSVGLYVTPKQTKISRAWPWAVLAALNLQIARLGFLLAQNAKAGDENDTGITVRMGMPWHSARYLACRVAAAQW
jgi:hypothetical protein